MVPFSADVAYGRYLDIFNKFALENEDQLVEVATYGSRVEYRGIAIFLLAHIKDPERLLDYLTPFIFDESSLVRNNAMRVITMMAMNHQELIFPVDELIQAMDFPNATDRNKATLTLSYLAQLPRYREIIFKYAIPTAMRLMRLKQPNNVNSAYLLLKTISGRDFGEDYKKWQEWYLEFEPAGRNDR